MAPRQGDDHADFGRSQQVSGAQGVGGARIVLRPEGLGRQKPNPGAQAWRAGDAQAWQTAD